MAKEDADPASSPSPSGLGMSPIALIIPILNTLALLGTLGVFYYSKVKFKRTPITEESERVRLEKVNAAPATDLVPGYVDFEPVTVNIASTPAHPLPADGTSRQIQGKLHYATVALSLEIRDRNDQDLVIATRPAITDKLLTLLGKKQFHELTTVQGRYILHSQILEFANQQVITAGGPTKDGLITNAYFTQFLIQ